MKRTRAHSFVTRSLQNINSSALDLASISHYGDGIERAGRQNCSVRQQLENEMEENSSKPFTVS